MLENLHVKNLAIIDESEVAFGPGLNILTGETGAGKSIIIGSVNLALGAKASKELIRENADYALVELLFSVDEKQTEELKALDIFPEDGQLIISRKIMPTGRSVMRINSETVTQGTVKQAASILIDIHGQHDHQSLLTRKNHLKYLDAYGGEEMDKLLCQVKDLYRDYIEIKRELAEALSDEKDRAREISFLEYEVKEIQEADLKPGEDEELEIEFRRLSNGRKIIDAVSECANATSSGRDNAADLVARGLRELSAVADYDENVADLASMLSDIENLMNDFNRELSGYADSFDFSDALFAETEKRLDEINRLKGKYGRTIEDVLSELDSKKERLDKLAHIDEYTAELSDRLEKSEEDLDKLCEKLSEKRKKLASSMETEMVEVLKNLNFMDVRFEIVFEKAEGFSANGYDEVSFTVSTNIGESLKPLENTASGGELSRIMLALKTVLAENDDINTLIFDEIDSGISGRTAQSVATQIKRMGNNHQVICITHLPQIASMADNHFLIEKTHRDSRTISGIRMLDREESIQELARMLGGVEITQTVLDSASEMKSMAERIGQKGELA